MAPMLGDSTPLHASEEGGTREAASVTRGVNHLAGRSGYVYKIIAEFTDEQLVEQSAWFSAERKRYLAEPNDGKPYGNRYAAWRMSVTDSAVWAEIERRRNG